MTTVSDVRMFVRGALTLVLAAVASAQDGRTDTIVGRVLDADRRPIRAAEVVLLHRPIPWGLDPAREHRVVVRTDDGGVFRAAVLPSLTYSVWATWPGGASRVAEGAEAGSFVTLQRDLLAAPEHVVVAGLEAWRDRGPFRLRTVVGAENLDFVELAANGDEVTVPAMPAFEYRQFEVLAADGEVLWCDAARYLDAENVTTLTVPAPLEIDVAVLDAGSGEPLAGAEILWHIRNYWTTHSPGFANMERFRPLWPRVGITDAAGRVRIRIPAISSDGKVDGLWLLARKPGFRSGSSGRLSGHDYRDGVYVEAGGDVITMKLEPPQHPALRLRLDDETFLRAGPVALGWRVWARGDRGGSGTMYSDSAVVADGLATLAHPPAENTELECVSFALPIEVRESLAERFGCLLPSALRWRVEGELPSDGFDLRSITADLRLVEVVSPFGQPAARVVLVAMKMVKGQEDSGSAHRHRTDRLGRVLVDASELPLRLLAMDDGIWGTIDITAESVAPLRIVMEELPRARVRVLDASDQPVPDVVVTTAAFSPVKGGESDDRLGQVSGPELGRWRQVVRSDADGRVDLACPPLAGTLRLVMRDPQRPRASAGTGELELPRDPRAEEPILRWVRRPENGRGTR